MIEYDIEQIKELLKPGDFVVHQDSGMIEITRPAALKLVGFFDLSVDSTTEMIRDDKQQIIGYIGKVTLYREGEQRRVTQTGVCELSEIRGRGSKHHRAAATAETRALKRALEVWVGKDIINRVIEAFFPGTFGRKDMRHRGQVADIHVKRISLEMKKKLLDLLTDSVMHKVFPDWMRERQEKYMQLIESGKMTEIQGKKLLKALEQVKAKAYEQFENEFEDVPFDDNLLDDGKNDKGGDES